MKQALATASCRDCKERKKEKKKKTVITILDKTNKELELALDRELEVERAWSGDPSRLAGVCQPRSMIGLRLQRMSRFSLARINRNP